MELSEKGKDALITGIESDAAQETQAILDDAEKQAAEKRKYADKKAADLLEDARQRAQEQGEAIKRKVLSEVELEAKRCALHTRDKVMEEILTRVEAALKAKIGTADYRALLVDWTVEAVRGLDVEEAQLNASAPERDLMDTSFLNEVANKVRESSGKTVALILSEEAPLEEQGVLVTAINGRMAFNNQVKTRILRNRRKIHTLIHQALFGE